MVSEHFILRVLQYRHRGGRMYQLAIDNGLTPSMFSAVLHGYRRVDPGDERIVRIGAQLGLKPDECFAEGDRAGAA